MREINIFSGEHAKLDKVWDLDDYMVFGVQGIWGLGRKINSITLRGRVQRNDEKNVKKTVNSGVEYDLLKVF